MANYLTNTSDLTIVADAIRSKAGISGSITFPSGFASAIANIPTGGGSVSRVAHGVNFIDYDGTVVAAWEASEVASKIALPDNPSHDWLTAQGWNWSLANIKSYIASFPNACMTVGQMYITADGKTHIHIKLEDGRLSPCLGICPNGSVDVDWGDGTEHNTVTGSSTFTVVKTQHVYANAGEYVIKLTVTGSMGIISDNSYGSRLLDKNLDNYNESKCYKNAIKQIFIGSNIAIVGNSAFQNCSSLSNITIPSSVATIASYAFRDCSSLSNITIPSSVTTIDNYMFQYCYSLSNIAIPSSITNIQTSVFYNCYSLSNIIIPSSVIPISSLAFSGCHSLSNITIPSSVTSIAGEAFKNCYGLGYIKFTRTTPPVAMNKNAWTGIPTDCKILVPRGSLSAYTSATNYPSSSTYTYEEYDP